MEIIKYLILLLLALVAIGVSFFIYWSWNRPILIYAKPENTKPYINNNYKRGEISLDQALERVTQYLPNSLIEIRKLRPSTQYKVITTYVMVDRNWYYLFMDDYPWKAPEMELPGKYENLALKVHLNTGELVLPTWARREIR